LISLCGTAKGVPFQKLDLISLCGTTEVVPFQDWGLRCVSGTLDEALREVEAGAKEALAAGHLAFIGLVVISGKMQQAMQDKDFDLCR
jgi:hypothetical protein